MSILEGLDFDFLGDEGETPASFLATKERASFDLHAGAKMLARKAKLPEDGESVRAISYAGGFSSCSVVVWIAEQTTIHQMFASTLRVGKKEVDAVERLHENGKIENVRFILSGVAKQNHSTGKDYGYDRYFEDTCKRCGFSYAYEKNHSKVILLDTDIGKFAIETSSNFNENPKIEQFCITKSEAIYQFYLEGLFKR